MNITTAEPTQKSSKAISVWLVDDSQNIRSALKELLALHDNVRCTAEFHSPNAVLSALASRPGPDAILLDIQMGAANGLDAIRPIKALSRETQVVMFTTCYDSHSKQRALLNGASDFLVKSSPLEKIIATLQHTTQNPAPHLKLRRTPPAPVASHSRRRLWLDNCLELFSSRRRSPAQAVRG